MHIPSHMSFADAATLPCGLTTVALGLYKHLGIPLPPVIAKNAWILVYGGSSATGSLAIQFAKLSGLKVVTTCSPHNFDFVRKLGADTVFDYVRFPLSQGDLCLTLLPARFQVCPENS